jgi:hypothetical protein
VMRRDCSIHHESELFHVVMIYDINVYDYVACMYFSEARDKDTERLEGKGVLLSLFEISIRIFRPGNDTLRISIAGVLKYHPLFNVAICALLYLSHHSLPSVRQDSNPRHILRPCVPANL